MRCSFATDGSGSRDSISDEQLSSVELGDSYNSSAYNSDYDREIEAIDAVDALTSGDDSAAGLVSGLGCGVSSRELSFFVLHTRIQPSRAHVSYQGQTHTIA